MVNVYAVSELRQALDETWREAFAALGYKESHRLVDAKLAIGYSIAAVSCVSFVLDKKMRYEDAVVYQQWLVAAYVVLSVLFWWFIRYVERGTVYVGENGKSRSTVVVKADFPENRPLCKVEFKINGGVPTVVELPVTEVFTESGLLLRKKFYKWVEDQVTTPDGKKTT